jgi:hypothetical protein
MTRKFCVLIVAIGIALQQGVWAKDKAKADASPQIFRTLVDCRKLIDPTARLACYDKGVSALEQAAIKHDVVIADREMIREAQRAQFGYTIPSLRIFGGSDSDAVKELQSKVTSVRELGMALIRFTVEEGSVWEQTESKTLGFDPKPGTNVAIRAHAFGRYTATFEGQPSITVRRIR